MPSYTLKTLDDLRNIPEEHRARALTSLPAALEMVDQFESDRPGCIVALTWVDTGPRTHGWMPLIGDVP